MERATKLLVLASMAAALVIEAVLASPGWPSLLWMTLGTFAAASAVSLKHDSVSASAVLACAFVYPALLIGLRGQRFDLGYTNVWMAGLLGAITPAALRSRWAVPSPWKPALVLWALTVALVWPIVVLREMDFFPPVLSVPHASVAGPPGMPPNLAIIWVLNVALTLGVGLLWFDWLFLRFSGEGGERRFRLYVVGALAASWTLTTALALYQLLVDMTFLNSGLFAFLRRASGAMFDANAFGVIAALGTPVAVAWGCRTTRFPRSLVALAALVSWLALWASGSRTALAAGIVGSLFALPALSGSRQPEGDSPSLGRRARLLIGAVAVLAVVAAASALGARAVGPWQRVREMAPDLSRDSIVAVASELWNRNAYGTVAMRMIGEHPFFGVGVGAFHFLVLDYSRRITPGTALPFDNAQNWYRHQFTEFGLVGSVGWILWVGSFALFVLRHRASTGGPDAAIPVKGMVVAIGLVSLVGMPTQNVAVAITFWTLACWLVLLVRERRSTAFRETGPIRTATWIGIWAIVALSLIGTVWAARHRLRVPARAAEFGWPYAYGFFDPESGPLGPFRWVGRRGVIVLDAPRPWMKLTVWVNHRDLASNPVDVRVWRDDDQVLEARLTTTTPLTRYIPIPGDRQRIVLQARVSRVLRPADFGGSDPRELGVMVAWDFVNRPPLTAASGQRSGGDLTKSK